MTDLAEKSRQAAAKMQQQNPSDRPSSAAAVRGRIPLSIPERKLEVPGIPGYHLRWFRGTSQRLAQAERAGFEFVSPDEIQLTNVSLGGDAKKDGNTDLGSRVSVIEGSETDGSGQAIRMYLMKQKNEFYLEDKQVNQNRNDSIADSLTSAFQHGVVGGTAPGEHAADANARYVDKARSKIPELFRRKR